METIDHDQFGHPVISPKTAEQLRRTAPWMRFCAVIGVVGICAVSLIMVVAFTESANSHYHWHAVEWFIYLSIIAALVLTGIICYYAFRAASAGYRVAETKSIEALEQYSEITRKGWAMAGVLIITGLFLVFALLLFVFLGYDGHF